MLPCYTRDAGERTGRAGERKSSVQLRHLFLISKCCTEGKKVFSKGWERHRFFFFFKSHAHTIRKLNRNLKNRQDVWAGCGECFAHCSPCPGRAARVGSGLLAGAARAAPRAEAERGRRQGGRGRGALRAGRAEGGGERACQVPSRPGGIQQSQARKSAGKWQTGLTGFSRSSPDTAAHFHNRLRRRRRRDLRGPRPPRTGPRRQGPGGAWAAAAARRTAAAGARGAR